MSYHNHLCIANMVFNFMFASFQHIEFPISVLFASPLDCLVECNAPENLILFNDGHVDD